MYHPTFMERIHYRYPVESSITFFQQNAENPSTGLMLNISNDGMYFETQNPVEPRINLFIYLKQPASLPSDQIRVFDFYRSEVRWLKASKEKNKTGIGVKHINKGRFLSAPEFLCGLCEEQISFGKVHFVNDFIYLCPHCHKAMETCSGKNREDVIRFIEGNVL